jgi:ParB/RepB/Spo0J family partition protein
MSVMQRCENCGEEVGENKVPFTYYQGFVLCLDCFKRLQPYQVLEIDVIKIPERRLTSRFKNEAKEAFLSSIEKDGILQPLHVIKDANGNFWLGDGLHRLIALQVKGWRLVPVIVKEGNRVDAVTSSIKSNLLRGEANAGDLAEVIAYLKDSNDWTTKRVAEEVNLSESYVSRLYNLATKRKDLLEEVKAERLSIHGAIQLMEEAEAKATTPSIQKAAAPDSCTVQPVGEDSAAPLSLEDLGLTQDEREKQLLSEEGSAVKKRELMVCDFCGKLLSRSEVAWIRVHVSEYDEALKRIKGEVRDERGAEA